LRPSTSPWALALASAALLAACAHAPPPERGSTVRVTAPTTTPRPLSAQEGRGSWYGKPQHGGPTASGERFNMYALTAAHRTLRLGTHVRVTNLKNGRQVEVRINDRGPYGRCIIDLSYAAAQRLDMIKSGVVPVRIEVLP
jgi:rare lipoprotein A